MVFVETRAIPMFETPGNPHGKSQSLGKKPGNLHGNIEIPSFLAVFPLPRTVAIVRMPPCQDMSPGPEGLIPPR